MQTKGHLKSNGGIRGHSAGEVFPFIVYMKGTYDNMRWYIKKPNGKDMASNFKCGNKAHKLAELAHARWLEGRFS